MPQHITEPGTGLVERARALAPTLRARAPVAQQLRCLPGETVEDLRRSGLFRVNQPARFGGHEQQPDVLYDVVVELARACGSTAWNVFNLNAGYLLGAFPASVRDDVWADDPEALVCGVFVPSGSVRAEPGGYRLSGEWAYASGVDVAGWALLGATRGTELRLFAVPASHYRVVDDWFVPGLRATGSKRIVVDDALVPEHRSIRFEVLREGLAAAAGMEPGHLNRFPIATVLPPGIAAVALGVARGALDDRRREVADGTGPGGRRLAEQPLVQLRLSESAVEIDAAEALLRTGFAEVRAAVDGPGQASLALRAQRMRDAAFAARLCVSAVDRLLQAGGSSALRDGSAVLRAWHDVHAVASHASLRWDNQAQHWARVVLGLGPANPFLY